MKTQSRIQSLNKHLAIDPSSNYVPISIISMGDLVCHKKTLLELEQDYQKYTTDADIAIYAIGGSNHPANTKIGGYPFRNYNVPWPCRNQVPMSFLGQINFTISMDLFPIKLPGEILGIFQNKNHNDPFDLHFEWNDVANSSEYPTQSELYDSYISSRVYDAYLYRTRVLIDPRDPQSIEQFIVNHSCDAYRMISANCTKILCVDDGARYLNFAQFAPFPHRNYQDGISSAYNLKVNSEDEIDFGDEFGICLFLDQTTNKIVFQTS